MYFQHTNKLLKPEPVTFKGSGSNIPKILKHLNDAQKEIFKKTAFEPFVRTLSMKGSGMLCHMMLLHQLKPTSQSVSEKRLYFKIGDSTFSYGAKEFCLITGFNFGKNIEPKKMFKKELKSQFCSRVFPGIGDADVTVNHLKNLLESLQKLTKRRQLSNEDAVRVALVYLVCEGFFGKDKTEKVCAEWLLLVDDLAAWNR